MTDGREYKALEFAPVGDDVPAGRVRAYVAVFGPDLNGDFLHPGAFTASLARGTGRVPMLWGHDRYEPIGGSVSLVEDAKGLLAEVEFVAGVRRADEALALIAAGHVMSFSVGYMVDSYDYEVDLGGNVGARNLRAIDVFELSFVAFPAQPLAVVQHKAASPSVMPERDSLEAMQRFLRSR